MTVYAVVGGNKEFPFATTRGMGDFVRWSDALDHEQFPLIAHLSDWGWVNEVGSLGPEINAAIEVVKPIASLETTLRNLVTQLAAVTGESIVLTDGLSEDDDEDGEWWIDGIPVDGSEADNERRR